MDSNTLRKKFLEFFEKRGHTIVPSSLLMPDDPSVLLTTAGMQQFKPYFIGKADPMRDFGSKNTVSVQKSFRTSDIDEVGDESHLTFFEMLGNFSFGGYFKKEAIQYGCDFIVKELGLEIDYVSVFDPAKVPEEDWRKGVSFDKESYQIWQSEVGLPKEKIRREGIDNFWGPTGMEGPCGPTTEIYVKSSEGKSIEIWNIVFNEFYCSPRSPQGEAGNPDKILRKLETPGVDTGMGLERLAMVVQNVPTIFHTDLFQSFSFLSTIGNEDLVRRGRIIGDHLRASVFLLADGVRPSNKEAGYILRRLLRRLLVQANKLSVFQSLEEKVQRIIDEYGDFYKELKKEREKIIEEFRLEVKRFNITLEKGLKEFYKKFPEMNVQKIEKGQSYEFHKIQRITGKDAFYFYQTFGLTLEIIKDLAKDGGHIFDETDEAEFNKEFERHFQQHQEISRAGQEKKFGGHGLILHTGELKAANEEEVKKVTRLHTATHLLQASLRNILGKDVRQAGSDITAERTRFDFTFPRKLTQEELKKIEDMANGVVGEDFNVIIEEMAYEDAIAKGALAFFKEKYPSRVSVYSIVGKDGTIFSRELCGGPHVKHTSEIGKITIIKEESVAAGVRRIRAIVEP